MLDFDSKLKHPNEPFERSPTGSDGIARTQLTVGDYATSWLDERQRRGIHGTIDERGRLNHALPSIGHLPMRDVRPMHIRDMVRAIRARTSKRSGKALAPRTVRAIYQLIHNIFESAIIDEIIESSPVLIRKGELPSAIDAESAWRSQATFSSLEIVRLISDPIVHPRRRVLNALKALAGLRHGEAAGCCWRHIVESVHPLARLDVVQGWSSRAGMKATKTEVARYVPIHTVLMRILYIWRYEYWPRLYGRPPVGDDLIVPTSRMTAMDKTSGQRAMRRDLRNLGLRVEAGALRSRSGHDLRGWFMTQLIEDGADSGIVRRVKHCRPRDVVGGYHRFGWRTLCREISKLAIELPGGDPLAWSGKIRRPRRPLAAVLPHPAG